MLDLCVLKLPSAKLKRFVVQVGCAKKAFSLMKEKALDLSEVDICRFLLYCVLYKSGQLITLDQLCQSSQSILSPEDVLSFIKSEAFEPDLVPLSCQRLIHLVYIMSFKDLFNQLVALYEKSASTKI
ncbi:hypothetical protein Ciccas_002811 [Cichlidogyrus casuarinus]|uniref:Uncharacterized protein n=1 Tax=Cichlidogyrus casuarinus TaxID=1844966 RepID=A0ABD2QG67_9PLAT